MAKPGIAILAARAGIPVIPHAFVATRRWRVRSWDRLIVPKPFARVVCAYGPPVPPPESQEVEAIEDTRLRVERALNELHGQLEEEIGEDIDG